MEGGPHLGADAVGVYLSGSVGNNAAMGTDGKGLVTFDKHAVNLPPWGAGFNRCVAYNARTTHVEYSYRCIEQYAIHEFGHVLGFAHEMIHPASSDACIASALSDTRIPGPWTRFSVDYTIENPSFDNKSMMVYLEKCLPKNPPADAVRFGGTNLSDIDRVAVARIYGLVDKPLVAITTDNGMCLDMDLGHFANKMDGGKIQGYSCNSGISQLFNLTSDGELRIGNGMCVDASLSAWKDKKDGGKISAWPCNGGQNQKWRLEDRQLKTGSGMCLDMDVSHYDAKMDGAKIQLYGCNGGRSQKWNLGGAPEGILPGWPGLWGDRVDAALVWPGNTKAYFFHGSEYARYDIAADKVDPGYPLPIAGNWPGVFAKDLSEVLVWPNGKVYFFKGGQYVRFPAP